MSGILKGLSKLIGSGAKDLLQGVTGLVDEVVTTKEEREALKVQLEQMVMEHGLKLKDQALREYELEITDRSNARAMFQDDSQLQKIFALVFLVAYILLTAGLIWMVFSFTSGTTPLPDWAISLISGLFGAMSAKVNTITDFLFGSSSGSKEKNKLMHRE